MTLEMWIGASRSTMPPGCCACGFGLVWRLTMLMFCTNTRSPSTRVTSPCWPLFLPAITSTVSPLRMRFMVNSLQHFRCERDDLHEALAAQFAGDRPEDAGEIGRASCRERGERAAVAQSLRKK